MGHRNAFYNQCHAYEASYGLGTAYGYVPSLAAGIVFCVLFAVSILAHIAQAATIKVPGSEKGSGRQWWMLVFAVGALTELLGWAARTWSSRCPYMVTPFIMQISTLIIAPAFYTAGIYIILGRMIQRLGRSTSILSARAYLWIFCTCDIISLVIQAIGGGSASVAFNSTPAGNTKPGTNIMVAGIIFQMASIAVFTLFYLDFLRRCGRRSDGMPGRMKLLVAASAFAVALILARSVYRTIELLQGWTGYLITHERYFIGLDGSLMVTVAILFNFAHPGWLLRGNVAPGIYGEKTASVDDGVPIWGDNDEDATKYASSGEQTPRVRDQGGLAPEADSFSRQVPAAESSNQRAGIRGLLSRNRQVRPYGGQMVETS